MTILFSCKYKTIYVHVHVQKNTPDIGTWYSDTGSHWGLEIAMKHFVWLPIKTFVSKSDSSSDIGFMFHELAHSSMSLNAVL